MTSLLKNLEWKPSTVSWLSFVLMGLIVAGIGLSGTAHVVNYLQERLTAHGMEHNREVAEAIVQRILPDLEQAPPGRAQALAHAIGEYRSFGFRIVVIDRRNRALVADTEMALDSPLPLDRSWLAVATRSDGPEGVSPLQAGPARVIGENRHPVLIWLQEIATADSGDWLLGVAKEFTHEYEGEHYVFCCVYCRAQFVEECEAASTSDWQMLSCNRPKESLDVRRRRGGRPASGRG